MKWLQQLSTSYIFFLLLEDLFGDVEWCVMGGIGCAMAGHTPTLPTLVTGLDVHCLCTTRCKTQLQNA